MTGAAALVAGTFLGFLFGIPRALQRAEPNLTHGHDDAEPQQLPEYRINTNLEQISDWLTKILVGVGLTQLPAIGEAAGRLVNQVGDGLGSGPGSTAFAGAILVYFLVSGFLGGYVLTRTILTETFTQFDKIVSEKESRITEVEERNKELTREVQALHMVDLLLAEGPHAILGVDGHRGYDTAARQLTDAMRGVGSGILRLIFAQAQQVRSDNWRRNPVKMARTIPVFEALIKVDGDEQYHRNYGELGFALKDKDPPDYARAKEQLDEAIRIRNRVGDGDDPYFRLYEFSRALCEIALDPASNSGNPTGDPLKQEILDDLKAAASEDFLLSRIEKDPSIGQWLKRNRINLNRSG
jgi:hypothetical protein